MTTTTTAEWLSLTVLALMRATGERQRDLATALGMAQPTLSQRLSGDRPWTLADLDGLSAHYGVPVPDLVAGVDAAVRRLPAARRATTVGGTQTTIPASPAAAL
ncbi:helix-turn-helix domain-containing protein [Streptomyces otsuchiensis]|uniref:helix-turn-helix domain-containing protein n=1 Tax=Streptomyces otsuchiensis TaxID=2681388 RepID=UPI0010312883|nr:helix-turn-helix transcriptional regulator [Streptomyces otsuchiensis]